MALSDLPVVKLDNFEGPFDLLIELARAEKVDLTQVSLARITDAYLRYLEEADLPPTIQADFLIVAATLLLLKLNQLLPELNPEETAEVNELTDRVRVYQYYRAAALHLKQQWNTAVILPAPQYLRLDQRAPFPALDPASLATAWRHVITALKLPLTPQRHLRPRGRSLAESLTVLIDRVRRLKKVVFQDVTRGEARDTVAITFLAALELARQHQVQLQQAEAFGALHVEAHS